MTSVLRTTTCPEVGPADGAVALSAPRSAATPAVVLAEGAFRSARGKIAHGLVRGSERFRPLAVVDSTCSGGDAGELLGGPPVGIPVVADIAAARALAGSSRTSAVLGVAPHGGRLTTEVAAVLLAAGEAGFDLVSGLHDFLAEDSRFVALAERRGITLTDVRRPAVDRPLRFWTGEVQDLRATRIAVLGTDCMIGKRTTARLLVAGVREATRSAEMIYTGQTGWLQGGRFGIVLDSMVNDFVPGELEGAMLRCAAEADPDVMILEGQSGMRNPTGPGGGAIMMLSGDVHGVVLQHSPAREYYDGLESRQVRIPEIDDEIALLEQLGRPVLAVSLNTAGMDPETVVPATWALEDRLGRPVVAPLEQGVDRLVGAVLGAAETP